MSREALEKLGPLVEPVHAIRHFTDDDLAELSHRELENVTRALRALSYSAAEGARRVERYLHLLEEREK